MDLIAALALVLVIEGLALAIFAGTLPQMLAEIDRLGPSSIRWIGIASIALGAVVYLYVRSGP